MDIKLAKMLGFRYGTKNMEEMKDLCKAFLILKVDINTFDNFVDNVGIKTIHGKSEDEIKKLFISTV